MAQNKLLFDRLTELYKQLEARQDELYEFIKENIPEGSKIKVHRGNGIWDVTMVGASIGSNAGYFKGRSGNGKVHSFHFSDIHTITKPEEEHDTMDN